MKYGFTKLATDWNEQEMNSLGVRITKAILFFVPRANLDNEKLYPNVDKWFIEVDETGVPLREIGIDSNGETLFSAPNDRNFGLWTDSNNTFEIDDLEPSNSKEFETTWQILEKNA